MKELIWYLHNVEHNVYMEWLEVFKETCPNIWLVSFWHLA